MECNKEEAIRAKEIAEKKMQNGDFVGARKLGLKAQQLYPDLDNISQLLMVCEVHCCAQNKLNGSEMDWYGILQIERFSDASIVKKQFRKLALSLHPDKNKFAGSEAAFKLIGEANRVLTDPTKRPLYDRKFRGTIKSAPTKPAPDHSNLNYFANKQHVPANKVSGASHSQQMGPHTYQQSQQPTFWTICPFCNMAYQYYAEFRKRMLRCQKCQQPFMANDLGFHPGSSWSQFLSEKRVPNQGPSKFVPRNNSAKPSGMSSQHRFPQSSTMPKMGTAAGTGGDCKPQERVNGHVDMKAGNRGDPVSIPDVVKTQGLGTSKSASDKRSKKTVKESSGNFDKGKNGGSEGSVGVKRNGNDLSARSSGPSDGHPSRISSRHKQHVSYEENLSDHDDFVPPPKRAKGNSSPSMIAEEIKEASVNGKLSEADISAGFANAAMNGDGREGKREASSNHEEKPSSKNSKTGDSKAEGEVASVSENANDEKSKIGNELNSSGEVKPNVCVCPDPDFSNFERERAENGFAVNQVWACYDTFDGMPRFYARIRKVMKPAFKLQITWLEASPDVEAGDDWLDSDLPIACGRFWNGSTEETEDHLMFSHQMRCMNSGCRSFFLIYPKKGETWALFKDRDRRWSSEPEKHKPPYEYEFVEILTDFSEDLGIGVAYLGKVKGFVSIFQQVCCNGVLSFRIQPNELYRFSHRIPSFKMTGKEGEGVPAGSYELDTAALAPNFGNLIYTKGVSVPKNIGNGAKNGTPALGRSPRESIGPCKDANDAGVDQQAKEKNGNSVASYSKLTQPEGHSGFQANEKFSANKKLKDKFTVDALTPRRSPRDLSKRSSRLNGNQPATEDTDGHAATKKDDVGVGQQAKEEEDGISSFQANKKLPTPKGLEKNICIVDALTPRSSRRDLNMRSSQLDARQSKAEDTNEHPASNKDDSQSVDKMRLHMDESLWHSRKGRKPIEVDPYDFRKEKLEDKFQVNRIWAMYSSNDGLPRNYALVKKIESAGGFKLHVAVLESDSLQNNISQPSSCGTFKVKNGKLKVFPASAFSHEVKAKMIGKNRHEIYPGQGEVWAVYKREAELPGECDVVEVVEDNESGVKVVVLKQYTGLELFFIALKKHRKKYYGYSKG